MLQLQCKRLELFLSKLIRELTDDPKPVLLGIYLKEWKTNTQTKTCTQMFIATLCIIAKMYKQLNAQQLMNG